jgi:hypothetical protein
MVTRKNEKKEEEKQKENKKPVLPPPVVTEADKADLSRYANQPEAQDAFKKEIPPWVDYVNPDGSWHINYAYRGGVPDWWRDYSRNKAIDQYLSEYEQLKRKLEELSMQQRPSLEARGNTGFDSAAYRGDLPNTFEPAAYRKNVPGLGLWNRVFPNAPEPRFSLYMPPQMPRMQTVGLNPYRSEYQYPALGVMPGTMTAGGRPAPGQWYERFNSAFGNQTYRKPWLNW